LALQELPPRSLLDMTDIHWRQSDGSKIGKGELWTIANRMWGRMEKLSGDSQSELSTARRPEGAMPR